MLFLRKHGVLKKRSCAPAIGVSGNDEHALEGADVAHGLPRFGEIRRGFAALEMVPEVGVDDARTASGCERIGDAENDEATACGRIEAAGTLAELAGFGAEFAHLDVF